MTTAQNSQVTAEVIDRNGRKVDLGVFDTFSPGKVTAEITKHRAGGMGRLKGYGSLPVPDDATLSRVAENARDHEQNRWLRGLIGQSEVIITEQPLGTDGAKWGTPVVYQGKLSEFDPGEADSNSSDPRMFELTVAVVTVS